MTRLTISCIQTNIGPVLTDNLTTIEGLIRKAKAQGAEMVVLPENADCMVHDRAKKRAQSFPEDDNPSVNLYRKLANELSVWIICGSIAVPAVEDKCANRCLVFRPDGSIAGRYDKIHLYDAVPKPGEVYRESELFVPGDKAVLVETPWGKLGLSICYDVRFPHLYRALAKAGAVMLSVPAAFTETSGKAHWHTLLRARAIETGCFVFAAAQTGTHDGGRRTFGHSLIIAPWCEIIADGGEAVGVITATIDLDKVTEARNAIASLQHDRTFTLE